MSFVNPLFLIGGLAAAIPVLLHLIKREHARRLEFPTLMFLRRISKRTIRYQKLRHLLLLLLRVLAFLLIALAFTRPYREKGHALAAMGKGASAHIILVDNSLSMGYQDRWARARKAAADIVRKSGPDDKFAVLQFSDRTFAVLQLTGDPGETVLRIENLELTDQSTRYGQALRAAEKIALDAGTAKRVVHFISDFQKNGWNAEDQDFRFSPGIELRPIDVGSDDFSNVAIRDVRIMQADQLAGNAINIQASVMNFGNLDRQNLRVKLIVDERPVAENKLDLRKGESHSTEFLIPSLVSGTHPAVLEIDDPQLTLDNRFYMTIEARAKTPVLVVEPDNPGGERSPSFFLSKALNVDAFSPYKLTTAPANNLNISGGLLIWNNAPAGSSRTQEKLRDFVRSGGGLAIVLGDPSAAADFNRSFGSWLPVKAEQGAHEPFLKNRPAENFVLMTDVRMEHPIFQPFSRPHSGSFSSARFFGHTRVTVGEGAEVQARFDNGDPAVISMSLDRGHVLIFTSSADDSANDLPLKAVYAPFWQQILRYLDNFQERRHWLEVGDIVAPRKFLSDAALRRMKGRLTADEPVAVLDPSKKRLSMAPGSDGVAVEKAGFYDIRSKDIAASLAVNAASRESDLTHGNAEELTAGWTSPNTSDFPQDDRLRPEEQDRRQRIWSFLLIAAILFLVSELVLAEYGTQKTKKHDLEAI